MDLKKTKRNIRINKILGWSGVCLTGGIAIMVVISIIYSTLQPMLVWVIPFTGYGSYQCLKEANLRV